MNLKSTTRKKPGKNTNTWKLNKMLLSKWVDQEIKEEIEKYMETNGSENTSVQNLCDAAKVVLTGKLIVIQAYLKKQENSQTT